MTARALAGAGLWCLFCGEDAELRVETMDPGRPVGICQRGAPDHGGCGRVIATRDPVEAEAVWTRRRRRLTTARHALHLRAMRVHPDCDTCATDPERPSLPTPGTPAAAIR